MIVRYIYDFFIEAPVKSRILLCAVAVGAFVLTLAFSSRHDGLWRSDAAPSTRAAAQPLESMVTPTGEAAPAAAATNPPPAIAPPAIAPPAIAPPEPVQNEPYPTPDADHGERPDPRERAEHSSRTR
jgi:hypothetical protein